MTQQQVADDLVKQGMLFRAPDGRFVANGVQYDINVVWNETRSGHWIQASQCDHDCTSEHGGYDCSAALSRNPGKKGGLASVDFILRNAEFIHAGMSQAMLAYANNGAFERYAKKWSLPELAKQVMFQELTSALFEWNCFGGNPELHEKILEICKGLKRLGFRVNLTTTGKRLMLSREFREEFKEKDSQPALLALSADDISLQELEEALGLSLEEIKNRWRAVPKFGHGQAQKVWEALWTLKYVSTNKEAAQTYPPILFNMVIHKGNLHSAIEMITLLQSMWDKVIINPYFGQSSFETTLEKKRPLFGEADLPACEALIEYMISEAKKGNPQLTRRLHYWLNYRSVMIAWRTGVVTANQAVHMLAGYWLWHCGRGERPPYLQVARGNPDYMFSGSKPNSEPGGVMGSFWNPYSVQAPIQIASAKHVEDYVTTERKTLLASARSTQPFDGFKICDGCGMPRLGFSYGNWEDKMEFHEPVPGFGLSNPIIPIYRQQRMLEAGF